MKASNSCESFRKSHSPRLGRSGFEPKLKPYLDDVILLVLQQYTASQIREWVTECKCVAIGRHAVSRFVKRIQTAVDNIDKQPATRADAVLGVAIRKAILSRRDLPLLPMKSTAVIAETSKRRKQWTFMTPEADTRVSAAVIGSLVSSYEFQPNPPLRPVRALPAAVETPTEKGGLEAARSSSGPPASPTIRLPPLSARRAASNAKDNENDPLEELARSAAARKKGEQSKT